MGIQRVESKEFLTSVFHFNTAVQIVARLCHWMGKTYLAMQHAYKCPSLYGHQYSISKNNVCAMHYVQYFSYTTTCKMTNITLQT